VHFEKTIQPNIFCFFLKRLSKKLNQMQHKHVGLHFDYDQLSLVFLKKKIEWLIWVINLNGNFGLKFKVESSVTSGLFY